MKYPTIEESASANYIINIIQEACLEINASFIIVFVNRKAEELFSRSKLFLVGKYIWEIFFEPLHTLGITAIMQALKEKKSTEVNYFSCFFQADVFLQITAVKGGAIILLRKKSVKEIDTTITNHQNARQQIVGQTYLNQGVSARKRTTVARRSRIGPVNEEQFRNLVESYAQAVWETNPAGEAIKDSPSWRAYTGQSFGEWIGYGWVNAIHPEDRIYAERQWREAVREKRNVNAEFRVKHAVSNTYRWTNVRATSILDAEGNIAKWIGMNIDIHDHKTTEEALRNSEKLKNEFIAIASHELKTPVTSIKAYAQMLQLLFKEKDDDASAAHMEKINTQANRITDLINMLLDTTKLSEGQLPLHLEQFDLNKLIAEHIGDLQYLSEKHKVIFTPGNVSLITADRERVGQVLTNLISNAIKYSPEGGDIDIVSAPTENGVQVRVRDCGIGIPPEVKDKVFDRFFRVSAQIKNFPGMGLGLYITAGIIQRHGGTISVESEVGKGSVFIFTLPFNVSAKLT